MKGYAIVAALFIGILISCSESSDPNLKVEETVNSTLSASLQGNWTQIIDAQKESYHRIDLVFDGSVLHWKDSTVTTQGKYAITRSGTCKVLYLKNEKHVVDKYLMGRPSLTSGLTDVLVSDWRGTTSTNRNYRNVNSTKGWELMNDWNSSGAQPPIPEGVYVQFLNSTSVILEIDGSQDDYSAIFSRPSI